MKTIKLTQGKETIVDDEDYERLNQFKWSYSKASRGIGEYGARAVQKNYKVKHIYIHRELMGVTDRKMFIDHINGNGLDNRKSNLRVCTQAENSRNRIRRGNAIGKYKGVSPGKAKGRWRTSIRVNGKAKCLGTFGTELEGAIIWNIASRKYYGKFARPNVLP